MHTHHNCLHKLPANSFFRSPSEVGLDKAAVLELFKLTGTGNSGTSLTKALKYQTKYVQQKSTADTREAASLTVIHQHPCVRRYCRCRGVHVSPTVFANGLEDGSISRYSATLPHASLSTHHRLAHTQWLDHRAVGRVPGQLCGHFGLCHRWWRRWRCRRSIVTKL